VPVWFRWVDDAFEVVIAKGDVKLRHLARNPQCVLVVFEAVRPFRGLEVRGVAELVEGDVMSARAAIAGRYLGVGDGERFAAERRSTPGDIAPAHPRQPAGVGSVGNPAQVIGLDSIDTPAAASACGLSGCQGRCSSGWSRVVVDAAGRTDARATAGWWPVEILAPSDEPHRDGGDVPQGRQRSFRWSFHLALLGASGANWLDDASDLSCEDSTD
jgi:hypothetical protein